MPPGFVSLAESVLLLPVCTLPKLKLVGFALRAPAVTAVPDKPILRVGLDALLTIAKLPVKVPLLPGANTTLKFVLEPALRVTGNVRPLRVNDDPVTFACEIVTLEVPELVSVSDRLLLPPTGTEPKLRLGGFAAIVPAEVPVPESEILSVGFDPLLVTTTLPLTSPLACGAKPTLKDVLWPGERVNGSVSPLRLKPLPLTVA